MFNMTYGEIFEAADGYDIGSDELKAKDEARCETRELVLKLENYDLDNAECPEDVIEEYCNLFRIKFNEYGNILEYTYPKNHGGVNDSNR